MTSIDYDKNLHHLKTSKSGNNHSGCHTWTDGWPLISEEARPLGQLANPCWRRMLRHIYVYSTPTEPTYSLYCIYAEKNLVTVSVRERMINSLNKATTLKPSVTMTCHFMLAQPSTASKGVCLPNFNPWYGFHEHVAEWLENLLSDHGTCVKISPGSSCQGGAFLMLLIWRGWSHSAAPLEMSRVTVLAEPGASWELQLRNAALDRGSFLDGAAWGSR